MPSRPRASARRAEPPAAGALERYRAKRNFARTSEPPGADALEAGRRFVVHKHAARRLHYDLRLELGGAYKSWAVTRGPSFDPGDKRLAVHVEDHPLDYGTFEGTIPEGEYGGGTVMLWDSGVWEPEGDADENYAAGRLKFRLHGQKLGGAWMLVRIKGRQERQDPWLLIKERDEAARPGDPSLPDDDLSVLSGRSMAGIAAGDAPEAGVAGGDAMPRFVKPQLATPAAAPPAGDDWLFEIKHDGYRCQIRLSEGDATVSTRGAHDWSARFPGIVAAAGKLPARSALLDGEAVVLGKGGSSDFAALRKALEGGGDGIVCYAFDLLFHDGADLRARPLSERKRELARLLRGSDVIRYSDHVLGAGEALLRHACVLGAEGLIAKRADRPYRSGRGTDWLKLKCVAREEVVIGGFTGMRGGKHGLGALAVGHYEGKRLVYAGRVGTGWNAADEERLLAALRPLLRATMPFERMPSAMRRGVRWVEPKLVAEVSYLERTPDGMLRHASWLGMREDKDVASVRQEVTGVPNAPERVGRVRLSHPERIVLAEPPTTKGEVWAYYHAMAERVLAGIANRPLSVLRCPSGAAGTCFFQRHLMRGMPKSVRPVAAPGKAEAEAYFAIDDREGLLALVQFGAIELHPWGVRIDRLDRPDRLVFDLDPAEGLAWPQVVAAAGELRERLTALGLESFARTTGGKGLHLVVPIERRHGWPAAKRFAASLARSMAADSPQRYTAKLAKVARRGRIFIDYLRNEDGATAVASYSLRARTGATVAMPVAWDEVDAALDPLAFTIATVPALEAARPDPWAGIDEVRQRLPAQKPNN